MRNGGHQGSCHIDPQRGDRPAEREAKRGPELTRSDAARSVRYGYQEDRGESPGLLTRILRLLHHFGKRDVFAFVLFVFALAGQLPLALPIFGIAATLILLPITARASFRVIQKTRRVRIA